jgi:hydroxymethylglutaryl-CoA lyase
VHREWCTCQSQVGASGMFITPCHKNSPLIVFLLLVKMKDTVQVIENMRPKVGISYPILVPNERGLLRLLEIFQENKDKAQSGVEAVDEIAIFTAASETFCQKNTNCSIEESLDRLSIVTRKAKENGLRVRGYISVVAVCPFEGKISPKKVKDISDQLLEMGCYEVSLGDTVGAATPSMMLDVLDACTSKNPTEKFAAHCHDTMGTGLSNVLAMVNAGVRTVDSAVGGLGGCPYSPGATGNIDSESVIFALEKEGYSTGIDLDVMAKTGQWISDQLNRPNNSSAGRAILSRLKREAAGREETPEGQDIKSHL